MVTLSLQGPVQWATARGPHFAKGMHTGFWSLCCVSEWTDISLSSKRALMVLTACIIKKKTFFLFFLYSLRWNLCVNKILLYACYLVTSVCHCVRVLIVVCHCVSMLIHCLPLSCMCIICVCHCLCVKLLHVFVIVCVLIVLLAFVIACECCVICVCHCQCVKLLHVLVIVCVC